MLTKSEALQLQAIVLDAQFKAEKCGSGPWKLAPKNQPEFWQGIWGKLQAIIETDQQAKNGIKDNTP